MDDLYLTGGEKRASWPGLGIPGRGASSWMGAAVSMLAAGTMLVGCASGPYTPWEYEGDPAYIGVPTTLLGGTQQTED